MKAKENKLRINNDITAPIVRLVGDNVEPKVCAVTEALRKADALGLDLVEISPGANPPVCKILDYQKYCYEQKKKEAENRKKAATMELKEVRFTPNIGTNDYEFKKRQVKSFLEAGNKVKTSVFFKGRSIMFADQGKEILLKLAIELEEIGAPEAMPVLEGKRMIMMIRPIKKK